MIVKELHLHKQHIYALLLIIWKTDFLIECCLIFVYLSVILSLFKQHVRKRAYSLGF